MVLVQSDYLIYPWQPLGKGTCSHFSKRVLLFRLFNLLFFFHCLFSLTVTSWGMFSLSSRRFENWPPCLLAPPKLDRDKYFDRICEYIRYNIYRISGSEKLKSSSRTRHRCDIYLNRILGIKGLLWKQKMGETLEIDLIIIFSTLEIIQSTIWSIWQRFPLGSISLL